MITPMEIQNHEFKVRLKGFEKEAVRQFLYAVAEDFETLVEQNGQMSQELGVLRARVADLESREKVLKDTLVTAQQMKEEIQQNAEKEAELVLKEAQLNADSYYEDAKKQAASVQAQIAELKRVRNDLLAEAEMMAARFGHFLDAERVQAHEADKLHNFTVKKAKSGSSAEAKLVAMKAEVLRRDKPAKAKASS